MSLFEWLKEDHHIVKSLLKKIENSRLPDERKELFRELKAVLTSHSRCEEEAVYEVVKDEPKTHSLILENYEEHQMMDNLLEKLESSSPAEDVWTAKITVLRELFEHHFINEEEAVFPRIKNLLDGDQLSEMAENYVLLKKERMAASHSI